MALGDVKRAIKRFSGPDLHQKNVKKHFVSDRESADDLNGVCSAVIQRKLLNWGRVLVRKIRTRHSLVCTLFDVWWSASV